MNYIGLIFSFGGLGVVIGVLIAGCVYDACERRAAKKRHKRCHGIVSTWQDLYVGDGR